MKFDIPVGRIRNRRDVYQSLSTFQEIPQEASQGFSGFLRWRTLTSERLYISTGVFKRDQIPRQLYQSEASRILPTMRSYLSTGRTSRHCCAVAFCQLVRGEDRAPCLTRRDIFGCQICCASRCTLVRCQVARGEDRELSRVGVFLVSQSTADIVAMKVSQFQKDRNEQARTEFELVLSMCGLLVLFCPQLIL